MHGAARIVGVAATTYGQLAAGMRLAGMRDATGQNIDDPLRNDAALPHAVRAFERHAIAKGPAQRENTP